MIGRSISSPTSFRSWKPFMAGMYTSLMTRLNLSLFALGTSGALVALPHVVTKRKHRGKTPTLHHLYFYMQSPWNKTHCSVTQPF
jgi:hypothetical protein